MTKEFIGLAAVLLSIVGHLPYITDTIKGKTKPHVFTWVIWAIVTILAFLGQWLKGGGAGSWTTGVTGLITILVALLALKHGSKDIRRSDKLFFAGALIAIIPWYLTDDPTLSIVIITLIDVLAFIPTVRKTIGNPSSETLFTYALNIPRHGLALIALENYNLATYLYPASLFVMNILMTFIIIRPKTRDIADLASQDQ